MNRRAFVTGSFALLAAPLAAEAQQAGQVFYRVAGRARKRRRETP
ncbi:MAG TPA: hypothetical protein VFU28_23820 [Vicinamibacterales bacterium]|nr:hypothetical protein [Vicinamibacterales bacterium]